MNLLGYIDPAATSVLLSSIVAICVAIGASAIIIWRKVKKGVSKTFHIDPNAKKEVEEDIVLNSETTPSNEEKVSETNTTADSTEKEETKENKETK